MDGAYILIRLVGGAIAVTIYAALMWQMFTGLKSREPNAGDEMREITMVLLLLMSAIAFLLAGIALFNTDASPIVRFVNSLILGSLIVGGWHLRRTNRRGRHFG